MPSPVKLLFSPKSGLETGFGPAGLIGVVGESAVEYGAGFAMGQVYHRYGDTKLGRNAPRIAAFGGKLAAVIAQLVTKGQANVASGVFNGIGSAGVAACGLDHGLRMARASTGKRVVLLPKDAALPANSQLVTSIGELPPAPAGRGLSWDQMEELAAGH